MYLVAGHFNFKEDGCKRAIEWMNTIVKLGRGETGIHQYTFYPNPDEKHGYFLFEEWNSQKLHDNHFESDEMQALVPEFFDLLSRPPDVSYFDATLISKL